MIPAMPAPKHYDRAYFDRWYRDPRWAVVRAGELARRVQLAVAAAEYVLGRPVASVLDVGCGEAPWREPLLRARPDARYLGVDASPYVVKRFGRRRNIVLGDVATLGRLGLAGRFDLIVCADVLHYVPAAGLKPGLRAIARLTGGVAWIEVYTREDDTIGDDEEYHRRGAATYRRHFREAGLVPVGLHCCVTRATARRLTSFERGSGGAV